MAALISHAQNFEDVMLWRALRDVEHGRYVDIGAQDPVVDSVSLLFYERGWRGTHVEASAEYAQGLRVQRPGETVIQAAAAAKGGTLKFFEFPGTGLGTSDAAIAKKHAAAGFEVREATVPAITLDDILDREAGEVHWLKIDVEGAEKSVLGGWKTSTVRPWIVVVESTLPLSQVPTHKAWERLVLAKGYKFAYFDGLNRFYVSTRHPKLMAAFASGPNVFDGFSIGPDGSGAFAVHLNERIRALASEVERVNRETQASLEAKDREHTHQWQIREGEFEKERQWLGNERVVLSDRLDASERAALEATRAIARMEEEQGAKVAAQVADAARLAQSLADRQREVEERLRSVQAESLATARRLAEREQEFALQVAAINAAAAEREQAEAARVVETQAVAAQREAALEERVRAGLEEVARLGQSIRSFEEQDRALRVMLAATREEVRSAREALASRLREFAAQAAARDAEIARANQVLAAREAEHDARLRESQQETRDAYERLVQRERDNGEQLRSMREAVRAAGQALGEAEDASRQAEGALLGQVATLRREAKETAEASRAREEALESDLQARAEEIERRERARLKLADRLESLAQHESGESRLQADMLAAVRDAAREWRGGAMPDPLPKWEPLFDEPAQRMAPAADVAGLLAHDGRAFIECAYATLLQRRPDRTGLAYYFGRLVAGYAKLHLLGQILDSREGRSSNVQVAGLREAVDAYRRRALPLVGSMLGGAGERGDSLSRRLRAAEQALIALERRGRVSSGHVEQALSEMRGINEEVASEPVAVPPPRVPARLAEWPERTRAIYARLRREAAARIPEAA